jgi:hypothetical protein
MAPHCQVSDFLHVVLWMAREGFRWQTTVCRSTSSQMCAVTLSIRCPTTLLRHYGQEWEAQWQMLKSESTPLS